MIRIVATLILVTCSATVGAVCWKDAPAEECAGEPNTCEDICHPTCNLQVVEVYTAPQCTSSATEGKKEKDEGTTLVQVLVQCRGGSPCTPSGRHCRYDYDIEPLVFCGYCTPKGDPCGT